MPSNATAIVVIPAYNEELRISGVIASASEHLPVLVVDDGSTDETARCAKAAGASVLSQAPNQGKGAALRAGFNRSIDMGYESVLTLDADGQHDPAEIPKFLDALAFHHADLVIGQRDFSQMPPVRRLANSLGQTALSWALGQHLHDNQCGYRIISRRLMEKMLASSEQGFEFEVEMILVCVRNRLKLEWVPIRTLYAGEDSHINSIQHLVNFSRMVWQTRRTRTIR